MRMFEEASHTQPTTTTTKTTTWSQVDVLVSFFNEKDTVVAVGAVLKLEPYVVIMNGQTDRRYLVGTVST
jgi:uncharacterized membrane protein YcaP (DUF421 family)